MLPGPENESHRAGGSCTCASYLKGSISARNEYSFHKHGRKEGLFRREREKSRAISPLWLSQKSPHLKLCNVMISILSVSPLLRMC